MLRFDTLNRKVGQDSGANRDYSDYLDNKEFMHFLNKIDLSGKIMQTQLFNKAKLHISFMYCSNVEAQFGKYKILDGTTICFMTSNKEYLFTYKYMCNIHDIKIFSNHKIKFSNRNGMFDGYKYFPDKLDVGNLDTDSIESYEIATAFISPETELLNCDDKTFKSLKKIDSPYELWSKNLWYILEKSYAGDKIIRVKSSYIVKDNMNCLIEGNTKLLIKGYGRKARYDAGLVINCNNHNVELGINQERESSEHRDCIIDYNISCFNADKVHFNFSLTPTFKTLTIKNLFIKANTVTFSGSIDIESIPSIEGIINCNTLVLADNLATKFSARKKGMTFDTGIGQLSELRWGETPSMLRIVLKELYIEHHNIRLTLDDMQLAHSDNINSDVKEARKKLDIMYLYIKGLETQQGMMLDINFVGS